MFYLLAMRDPPGDGQEIVFLFQHFFFFFFLFSISIIHHFGFGVAGLPDPPDLRHTSRFLFYVEL